MENYTIEYYKNRLNEMQEEIRTGKKNSLSEFDTSLKNHPAPEDGLTLKKIAKNPNYISEIKKIYKEMEQVPNKSNNFVMYANGFAFTWTELKTLYDFVCQVPAPIEKDVIEYEITKIDKPSRKTITVDAKTYDIYKDAIAGLGYPASISTLMMKLFARDILENRIVLISTKNDKEILDKLNKL